MTYSITTAADFIAALTMLPTILKVYVTLYTEIEYAEKGAVCYLSEDGRSGYAITSDLDLISVFSLPGANHGRALVKSAIANGAQTLNCIDGFLPEFYSHFGFAEYDRVAWDDQYAPENWDYEANGRPDIVFMKLES